MKIHFRLSNERLREMLQYAHKITDKPLLVRLDSGNDSADNDGILLEDGSWFIVKRNPRRRMGKKQSECESFMR